MTITQNNRSLVLLPSENVMTTWAYRQSCTQLPRYSNEPIYTKLWTFGAVRCGGGVEGVGCIGGGGVVVGWGRVGLGNRYSHWITNLGELKKIEWGSTLDSPVPCTEPHTYLILLAVGLKPHIPQNEDGMRILPPMSVPIPRMEPPPPMRAPSPPEEPPGVFWRLCGFRLWPNKGLPQS